MASVIETKGQTVAPARANQAHTGILLGVMCIGAACGGLRDASAASLGVLVGEDAFSGELAFDSVAIGIGGAEISLGATFSSEDDKLFSVGLLRRAAPSKNNPFSAAVGVKYALGNLDAPDADFQALAIGLELMHHIPARYPVALGGSVFYAPDITTWGDGNGFLDASARIEVSILPNTAAYVGYRKLRVDLERGSDYEVDNAAHFGVRIQF